MRHDLVIIIFLLHNFHAQMITILWHSIFWLNFQLGLQNSRSSTNIYCTLLNIRYREVGELKLLVDNWLLHFPLHNSQGTRRRNVSSKRARKWYAYIFIYGVSRFISLHNKFHYLFMLFAYQSSFPLVLYICRFALGF